MVKVIIDRFEGNYAIVELEDMRKIDMQKTLIPKSAKEGDVLEISIAVEETKKRQQRVAELMDELWQD